MRPTRLLIHLLMLLAIVFNTVPLQAHAHAMAAASAREAAAPAALNGDHAAMPCHDDGSAQAATEVPALVDADADAGNPGVPPCCDDGIACGCDCLLSTVALPMPTAKLATLPLPASPRTAPPVAATPPDLPPLIRPPIA